MKSKLYILGAIVICLTFVLSACGPAAATVAPATEAPATVEPTTGPTVAPTAVPICLTIGVTYGGPVNDAGYNQAMRDSILAIKTAIPCVKILSAENVYDEAGATTTMEQMIKFGATLIFATASTHQNAAVALAAKYPNVKFESAGGWLMGANYANYYGNPPQGWYLMGIAAGMMTKTNKLGFVAAFPLGWTLTFVNAFELGAQSVNPAVQTEVKFTFDWASQAKEADATNALINDGADVVTMHVDAPGPIISTAESRGIYSIGFQSLAAQQFAPQYWIGGTGFTLGPTLVKLTQSVIDGTWTPQFLRCGISEGCMALAPWGPKVPQEVKDKVTQTLADMDSGKIVLFAGPIVDQDGNVVVKEGEVLSEDAMSNLTWFVKGVLGSTK
jgi:basic membrane lipoprotein Med (substrate-binding protein (PBP1-ABC) superfamily)